MTIGNPHPPPAVVALAVVAALTGLLAGGLLLWMPDRVAWVGFFAGVAASAAVALALAVRHRQPDGVGALLDALGRSGTPALATDAAGRVLAVNEAVGDAFPGMTAGKTVAELGGGGRSVDRAGALAALADAVTAGRTAVRDIPAGTGAAIRWWRVRVAPLAHGVALWQAEDISDTRESEAAARAEARLLADLLDGLPVGFVSTDCEGRLSYVNRTFAGWLGQAPDRLVGDGVSFAELVAGDFAANGTDAADPGRAGTALPKPGVGCVSMRDWDGERFDAYVIASRDDRDGGTRAAVLRDPGGSGANNDPPADTAATSVSPLSGFTGGLHSLFEEAPVGIAIVDLEGHVQAVNRAFRQLVGPADSDVEGGPFADLIAREDRDDVAAALSKIVMGTARAAHMDVRLPGAGEQEIAASVYASRMEREDGELEGILLHFIDQTEQKHLEVQFTQSQKMQAVGQLAGGVAHDFNNLLTAMIGFCDLLLQSHGPDDPAFADIMQIKQNANRATNLVRQLLAFSRKQTLEPVIIDPSEALADLSHLLGRLIGETVELGIDNADDLHLIRADRGQFDQVIINLAVNARDAMPGGGTLTVATRNTTVEKPVQRGHDVMPPGHYVVIEVADTGTGIAKENLERIFEPFFSTKEVGAGTGLGLSTVYGIVRQSEGYIFVDSAPGRGTTFSVYLPAYDTRGEALDPSATPEEAARAAEARRKVAPPSSPATGGAELTGSGTVLLVEDEDAVRLFGARALRNKGYTVLEASNGEEALDVINGDSGPIDLIVSDVIMPGMDGHTLVQLVRHELPETKVILMSGYAEDVFREEISRDPAIHFLAKPFSLDTLAGTVKAVLASGDSGGAVPSAREDVAEPG